MYMVSACLAGINCKYNGKNNFNPKIKELVISGKAIPLCPEVLGGMPTPRTPCEIIKDSQGLLKIISKEGRDFTTEFELGARKTLNVIKTLGIKKAILQPRSPSCGFGKIYDGSFSGQLIPGNGITAQLLLENNIKLLTLEDL